MKRRRKSSGPREPHPPVALPITAVLAQQSFILRALAAHGVPARHRDDVFQLVIIAAWRAIDTGRYRPDPSDTPPRALRVWLYGLSWRHAAHHRGLAHARFEVPTANPWAIADEPAVDGEAAMVVADLARLIRGFPRYQRPVIALAADGHGVTEIADILGIPVGTAWTRLRRVRDLLAERLCLWRRA